MDSEKFKIAYDKAASEFQKRTSELRNEIRILFRKQPTTEEIVACFIDVYSKSKLVNPDIDDDDFYFGYDGLLASGHWTYETEKLGLTIERRTRPILDLDEEQLILTLEYDIKISYEQFKKEANDYIYGEEYQLTQKLKNFEPYNSLKNLKPINYNIKTHYDA